LRSERSGHARLKPPSDTFGARDITAQGSIPYTLVSYPDPNNPSADRFQYLAQGRRVWGFEQG